MTLVFVRPKEETDNILTSIDSLLLDFDGTLVDYYENEANALSKVLSSISVPKEDHKSIILRYREINEELWKKYEKKLKTVDEVQIERFSSLNEVYGLSLDPQEFNRRYLENFAISAVPFPNIVTKLKSFREIHPEIKVVILTNGFHSTQQTRAETTGIKALVDGIVSSDQVGIAKPSPKIFEYTTDLHGINPKRTFMVGDSLTSDIQGAVNVNIPSCYIDPNVGKNSESGYATIEPRPDLVTNNCVTFLDYISQVRSNHQ